MKPFIAVLLLLLVTISCGQQKEAVGDTAAGSTEALINQKHYTFRARTLLPPGGRTIQLTTNYDLRIAGDSLISFLPYFGRAYSAPVGSNEAGFQFTSTSNDYQVDQRKKGGWLISIRPKDHSDVQQMFLTVSQSGSASLQVTSLNRQPISYNGVINAE